MRRNGPLALLFHGAFITFVLAPILVVCAVAFTSKGYLSLPTDGLSLRWFRAIVANKDFVDAFWASLWLGTMSATIAIGLSVPAALAIARYRFPGRDAITTLFQAPLMIPPAVLGIAFLRFFTQTGISGTFVGLVVSHVVIITPYAIRLVLSASTGMDPQIEHAIEAGVEYNENNSHLNLPPQRVRDILDRVSRAVGSADAAMAVVTSSAARFFLRQMIEGSLPNLSILSHNEIPAGVRVVSAGLIQ